MARKISRRTEYFVNCWHCRNQFTTTNPKHVFCSYSCMVDYKRELCKPRAIEQKPMKKDLFGFAA